MPAPGGRPVGGTPVYVDGVPRWPSPGAAALAAAVTAAHLVLGSAMRAPVIHPDEAGHLVAARYLAGRGEPPGSDSFPAYDLVLAPVARLASDPLALWRGALVVNALLAGVGVLLAVALARRMAPGAGEAARLAAVAAVSAYPALLLWSNLAVPENLLVPGVLATVLLAWRALESDRPRDWLVAGAAAGVVAAAFRSGIAVPVALVATAVVARRPLRRFPRQLGAVVAGAGTFTLAGWLAALAVSRRGRAADGAHEALERLRDHLEPGRLVELPLEVAGQLWYLTVGTWGLFPLGMAAALGGLPALLRDPPGAGGGAAAVSAAAAARVFVGLAAVAMLVAGSLFLRADGTIDALVAGRANEAVLAPVLLLALLSLAPLARRATGWGPALARRAAVVAATLAVTGGALVIGRGAAEIELPVVRTNVLGIDGLLTWRGLAMSVVLFSAAALAGAVVVLGSARRATPLAAGVAAALFLPSVATGQDFLVAGSRQRAGERAVAEGITAVGNRLGAVPGGCVGYDVAGASPWHRANYELFLPEVAFRDYSSERGASPCDALVVSGRDDLGRVVPGSHRVMLENDHRQALWALPGPAHDRLAREGWLLPAQLPAPVPPADRRFSVALARPEDEPRAYAMRRGAREKVAVTITHPGGSQPWPNANGLQSQFQSVRVGVRWYRIGRPGLPDGHPTLDHTRVELPRTLLPGERITLDVPLVAHHRDGRPLRAGTYQARIEVVQNGVSWFAPVGPPLALDVVVVGRIF